MGLLLRARGGSFGGRNGYSAGGRLGDPRRSERDATRSSAAWPAVGPTDGGWTVTSICVPIAAVELLTNWQPDRQEPFSGAVVCRGRIPAVSGRRRLGCPQPWPTDAAPPDRDSLPRIATKRPRSDASSSAISVAHKPWQQSRRVVIGSRQVGTALRSRVGRPDTDSVSRVRTKSCPMAFGFPCGRTAEFHAGGQVISGLG